MPRRPFGRRPGRPLRRPLRGPLATKGLPGIDPRHSGNRRIPPALIAANQLFKAGEIEEAGKTYLNLAERGIKQGFHQAPNLYFQAARCFIMVGKPDLALEVVHEAIKYLKNEVRWVDLYRGAVRVAESFTNKGYTAEAHQVKNWMAEFIPESVVVQLESGMVEHQAQQKRTTLPANCPACGGVVNPAEVEWVDNSGAICDYCGSVVRGE